jgi:glucose-6-phosphate isomerase
MIELKTNHSHVTVDETVAGLADYTEHLLQVRKDGAYDAPESSLNLPDDNALLEAVQFVAQEKMTTNLKYSIVVGIGGSNLGTKAVYDALLGYRDTLEPQRFPKMLFAETTDPEWLTSIAGLVAGLSSKDEVLVTVISKSGGTAETLANFEIIADALRQKFGDVYDRFVAITDEGSKLWQAAEQQAITCVAIPAQVGGRYSVFSAVGLFPLATVGVDITKLRAGAQNLLNHCLGEHSYAAESASVLALQLRQGRTINDNFFFHPELESLGKWYRQLMGESVGKMHDINGGIVHTGITPTVSLGSTDLHSVGQLYLGGPKDKLTTFVASRQSAVIRVPQDRVFADLVPMIEGKTAGDIMEAILEGVQVAYQKAELPYMEVVLDDIDEESIGAYLQFKMLEMMYLGKLLNVNSFDQPNVEAYKIETKRILEK